MNKELAQLYSAYIAEKKKEPSNKEAVQTFRNKLLTAVTAENINDIIDDEDNVLLHVVVDDNDSDLLRPLLEKKPNIHVRNKDTFTPMQMALLFNYKECIKMLYDHGGNIDDVDALGESNLFSAVRSGNYERLKLLMALNANVHAYANYQSTILDCIPFLLRNEIVDQNSKFKIIRLLLENYIGIGTDFSGIDLPPGVADGMPVIWATKDGKPITNETPNFEKAICSIGDLLKSKKFNFKKLQYVLEKVFRPYFPGENKFLYDYHISLLIENGDIRANNFVAAGPDLEQLYKDMRMRTAGISSLKELASMVLLHHHGLKLQKNQPIDDPKLAPKGPVTIPSDVEGYIKDLDEDIEKKLGHDRSGTK